jgi:hypothetical protein
VGSLVDIRESSAAPDRRQAPRTKLVEIAYIGMGPENGGLVLDVSHGGLSFHSVAPVHPSEKIQFLLSLRGHSRIEGTGEVVWTNEMKTICGLRFTSLSSGAREHLNNWTYQSKLPAQASERKPAATPQAALWPAAATETSVVAPASALGPTAAPVFAIRPAYDSPLTVPNGGAQSIWREPLFLWILFAVLGSAIGISAYKYGIQTGRLETSASTQGASTPSASGAVTQTASETSAPAPVSSSTASEDAHAAPADAPPVATSPAPMPTGTFVNASKTEDSSASAAQSSASDERVSPTAAPDRSEQQVQAGQSELAAAQGYLNGANGNRDSGKAARLLWAAVGNGNSTAEVLLADLYIRGDGVAKNCEQGRILLVAAIKSGNMEAQQKLTNLNATGCKQ